MNWINETEMIGVERCYKPRVRRSKYGAVVRYPSMRNARSRDYIETNRLRCCYTCKHTYIHCDSCGYRTCIRHLCDDLNVFAAEPTILCIYCMRQFIFGKTVLGRSVDACAVSRWLFEERFMMTFGFEPIYATRTADMMTLLPFPVCFWGDVVCDCAKIGMSSWRKGIHGDPYEWEMSLREAGCVS